MEKDTHKTYDRDRLYPVWTPPNPELEQAMFAAATREQIIGYDFCRERSIGQQAVWDTFAGKEHWVQDQLSFGE
jgi:ABC-type cobalt transport system substrate-binding protein